MVSKDQGPMEPIPSRCLARVVKGSVLGTDGNAWVTLAVGAPGSTPGRLRSDRANPTGTIPFCLFGGVVWAGPDASNKWALGMEDTITRCIIPNGGHHQSLLLNKPALPTCRCWATAAQPDASSLAGRADLIDRSLTLLGSPANVDQPRSTTRTLRSIMTAPVKEARVACEAPAGVLSVDRPHPHIIKVGPMPNWPAH